VSGLFNPSSRTYSTAGGMAPLPQRQLASMTAHVALSSAGRCRRLVELGALRSVGAALSETSDAHTRDAMLHCLTMLITGLSMGEEDILPDFAADCEQSLRNACAWATSEAAFSRYGTDVVSVPLVFCSSFLRLIFPPTGLKMSGPLSLCSTPLHKQHPSSFASHCRSSLPCTCLC
jgi:hypothetical protein